MDPISRLVNFCGKNYRLNVALVEKTKDTQTFEAKANNHTFFFRCSHPQLVRNKTTLYAFERGQLSGVENQKFFVKDTITSVSILK